MLELAHGVGRVYESPIPVSYYLAGAALTVLASFFIRARVDTERAHPARAVAGPGAARRIVGIFRGYLLVTLMSAVAFSVIYSDQTGYGIPALTFWVCLIIIPIVVSSVFAGVWPAASPWSTIEGLYRFDDEDGVEEPRRPAPWWLPPAAIYGLFWFELVSGKGFDPATILAVLTIYTLYVLVFQTRTGWRQEEADPLGVLFGFAQRIAPFEVGKNAVIYRGFVAALDEARPMPTGLFAAMFVLLASTTLDSIRETVGWYDFLRTTGLDTVDEQVVDSVALLALTLPFLLPFLACVSLARVWAQEPVGWFVTARSFGWSLIPIGIAYVLAHNMPLLLTGLPQLVQQIAEGFGSHVLTGYAASPLLVWILEIALIVGGHVVGVLAAHRIAVRIAGSHKAAVKSHVALTILMSFFTIATLWLLSLPIVTT